VSSPPEVDVEQLVAQALAALNGRDADGMLAMAHPDVELHSRFVAVEGRVYRGREGIERYFADLADAFGDVEWELGEIVGWNGDRLVLSLIVRGHGLSSGAPFEVASYQVWTFRGDRPWRNVVYSTREEALEAAGLR